MLYRLTIALCKYILAFIFNMTGRSAPMLVPGMQYELNNCALPQGKQTPTSRCCYLPNTVLVGRNLLRGGKATAIHFGLSLIR